MAHLRCKKIKHILELYLGLLKYNCEIKRIFARNLYKIVTNYSTNITTNVIIRHNQNIKWKCCAASNRVQLNRNVKHIQSKVHSMSVRNCSHDFTQHVVSIGGVLSLKCMSLPYGWTFSLLSPVPPLSRRRCRHRWGWAGEQGAVGAAAGRWAGWWAGCWRPAARCRCWGAERGQPAGLRSARGPLPSLLCPPSQWCLMTVGRQRKEKWTSLLLGLMWVDANEW